MSVLQEEDWKDYPVGKNPMKAKLFEVQYGLTIFENKH